MRVTPRYLSDYALNYVDKLQELTPAEQRFSKEMHELNEIGLIVVDEEYPEVDTALIGTGILGGYDHTNELNVLKHDPAMKSKDKDNWELAVGVEHRKMV